MDAPSAMLHERVYVFQHIACEDLGSFAEVLAARGVRTEYVRLYAGEPIPPDVAAAPALVFLGGPMSVNDEDRYPYLVTEKSVLRGALERQTPVLGVCLGAQLLAAAAGSRVFPAARPEIGWAPVSLTVEGRQDAMLSTVADLPSVFHWHGETFDLPRGAARLAFSGLTMNQAFCVGRCAYGLQFHLEVGPPMIAAWVEAYAHDLGTDRAGHARQIAADTQRYATPLHAAALAAMQRFLDLVTGAGAACA